MAISIETDHPVSISTDRPVSITADGGVTTLSIGVKPTGLVRVPRPPSVTDDLLPKPDAQPRCGAVMARSGQPCARVEGHNGVHMNAGQLQRKKTYNKQRARERYASDPGYAEKVRAGSRASHKRRRGDEPAAE
jgi:hypothetical protein